MRNRPTPPSESGSSPYLEIDSKVDSYKEVQDAGETLAAKDSEPNLTLFVAVESLFRGVCIRRIPTLHCCMRSVNLDTFMLTHGHLGSTSHG